MMKINSKQFATYFFSDNSSRHRTANNSDEESTRSNSSSSSSGGILSKASSGIDLPSHASTLKSTLSSSHRFLVKAASLKLKDFTSPSARRRTTHAHASQASSGIELPSHTSTRKSTLSSSDRFLAKDASLKLKDFISPSARGSTTHAHAAKKNNTTGSPYKNKNSPDISDYGPTGNACFGDEDVDDWELQKRTRSTTAGNGRKNKNTNSTDPPASRHDVSSIADEGEEDSTRQSRELKEIERKAREEDRTCKARRELEEIERQAREEIKCQNRAEHRRRSDHGSGYPDGRPQGIGGSGSSRNVSGRTASALGSAKMPPFGLSGENSTDAMNNAMNFLGQFDKEYYYARDPANAAIPKLVSDRDHLLLTDYYFYLMKQLRPCRFTENDRKTRGGKREKIKIGYGGLQCIHCTELPMPRKFFWGSVDRLANSFAEIPGHVLKCRICPQKNKDALMRLKQGHPVQMSMLPRGSQKIFFRRMWSRLHDGDPQDEDTPAIQVPSPQAAMLPLDNRRPPITAIATSPDKSIDDLSHSGSHSGIELHPYHISAPPTNVSSAAIASVLSAATGQYAAPSAVISSPVPTQQQQQQQQYELLHNSSRKEGETRGVVPPPIADVDLTSDLLATPLGIKTNGLDTSLSTPMRTLSSDDAPVSSEYARIQQELLPIDFFDPATTGSSPGSFSLGFPDLEEQLDDLSIADQQIVQTPGTIVDVASADGNLSILVDAVVHAGLAETLSSAGPYTVFAPTDAVWTKAFSKPVTEHPVDIMKTFLFCHTVAGTYTAADITNGLTLTTVQGVTIEFSIDGDDVMINGYVTMITGSDILASNGVIHTIDGILFDHRRRRVDTAKYQARKNMESGTAPGFVFGSPQPTLQVCSNRKNDGIETRIIDVPSSTIVPRDGETTGPVTSLHLEEDSDVSDIQGGLDSLSIAADKNDVKDLINNLRAKQKVVDDKKNNHARILAEKKTLADTLMQELEEKMNGARTRATKLRIKEKKLAVEKAIEDVDSLSAVDDTAARIEDSIVEEEIASLTNRLEELSKQEEALKKSDDTVLSKEKAESTALLPAAPNITSLQQQVRHDNANALRYGKDHANSLQYKIEIKRDFIYKHNDAYLKFKNNRGGNGPVTFFIPMNLALQGAEDFFEPKNYIVSGHYARKSLLEAKGLVTIGYTTLHFLGDHENPKVTISGEEELVANIVLSFYSTSDDAVLHLIDRALEEQEPEISDEITLSSIDRTIATGSTFGDCPVLEIIGIPSNLVLLSSSQELLTSSRPAAMSSMSGANTSNLLTVAAAKTEDNRDNTAAAANTEDNCDNMSYGSTKDANNVPVANTGSITTLEKLQEDMSVISLQDTKEDSMAVKTLPENMSVTSLLDTKEDDTSVLCTTLEKLRDDNMSVTTTMQHENLLHQQPQQQAIVWMPRNEQGKALPAGFNHQAGDESKFSIGYHHRTLEWAKESLDLDPCQSYHIEDMKRAYNRRILETHPDKNMAASEADREKFGEEFRKARAAWNVIKRGNAINKINRTIITTPRDTTTTPCDTQYANDLKKNLESFKELGTFLKELTRIHGVSYRLAEQRKNLEAHSADQSKKLQAHSADQRKKLQAHLAEVQPDQTARVAFIMQVRFEKKADVLSLRSEEDQAEMTALIDEAEMPALINANSTTTQKHKVDLAPAPVEPSTRKKKRQRRDNLEINMNNTGVSNINTRLRSGRRSSPN